MYFSPECHAAYVELGFEPSPGELAGVAMPDGPAYFTSRGSVLGQVEPEVVAAAFGVFNPAVVVGGVAVRLDAHRTRRRSSTPAATARSRSCTRDPRPPTDGLQRAGALLEPHGRAAAPRRPPALRRAPLAWDDPVDAWTRFFHLGDMLREYRGDAHVAAWTSAGLDAVEIGLLTEAYIGLPLRIVHPHARLDDRELDAAVARLEARGWMQDDALTDVGRTGREAVEDATDRAAAPRARSTRRRRGGLFGILEPWGATMREAGGYIGGPVDLWPASR